MPGVTVAQLWRFPVKSMGGHQVDEVHVDRRGVHADRLWAVRDLENDITASARRVPKLLGCSAAYVDEPGPDAGPGNVPEVTITFPDGTECSSSDGEVHRLLSELVGREVQLTSLPPLEDISRHRLSLQQTKATFAAAEVRRDFGLSETEPLPDTAMFTTKQILTLARYSTPPGTFVDLSPIHLMTSTSLASLSSDAEPYSVRRFRPNVLIDVERPESDYPESAWVGGEVHVGSVALRVSIPTIRCVVPTRPQPGIELDRGLTRRLVDRTDRLLGVYADVSTAGRLRVGDSVVIVTASRPNPARRALSAVSKSATRQVQRVLEATVLRE